MAGSGRRWWSCAAETSRRSIRPASKGRRAKIFSGSCADIVRAGHEPKERGQTAASSSDLGLFFPLRCAPASHRLEIGRYRQGGGTVTISHAAFGDTLPTGVKAMRSRLRGIVAVLFVFAVVVGLVALAWHLLGAVGLFTGLLVVVGYLQFRILQKSNETSQAAQRAWLAPRGLEIPDNFVKGNAEYTEIKLGIENAGNEPAIETNEVLFATTLPLGDFRNREAVEQLILRHMKGRTCSNLPLDPNGRAIFPGSLVGTLVGLTKEDTTLALAVPRTHFALVGEVHTA